MKSIDIRYFALLRELAGKDGESMRMDCETYADLYALLAAQYGFTLPQEMVQVAVNDEFSQLQCPIEDGAKVVFIPPVAGG